jgi:transcriptional regulator with XRE-family HTH domain
MENKKAAKVFRFSKAFGKALKNKRLANNLSQEELAFRTGLDRTYVSGVERGLRNPTLQIAWRLACGLEVSLAELISIAEQENNQNALSIR